MPKNYTVLNKIDWDKVEMEPMIATQGYPSIEESEEVKAHKKRREKVIMTQAVGNIILHIALPLAVLGVLLLTIHIGKGMMDGTMEPLPIEKLSGFLVMMVGMMFAILFSIRKH